MNSEQLDHTIDRYAKRLEEAIRQTKRRSRFSGRMDRQRASYIVGLENALRWLLEERERKA